jgi:hypothetical protein
MIDKQDLNNSVDIMTSVYFCLGLLGEVLLLILVRKELDPSMHLILALELAALFFRVPILGQSKDGLTLYTAISTILTFGLLY